MPEIRLPMRPGGFESALRSARRRRRIQVSASGGVGASLVVLAFVFPRSGGIDSLRPVENPVSGITATESATPNPSASPGPEESASPSPSADPSGVPAIPGGPGEAAPEPSPVEETLEPLSPARSYPITRDEIAYDGATATCASNDTYDTGQGWCVQFPGPFTAKTGSTQAYRAQLCRLPGFPAATLTFSGDEASFDLTRSGRTEWVSNRHPQDSAPASAVVQANRCERWSVVWDTLDVNGEFLPPANSYTLDASIYTDASIVGSRPSTAAVIALSSGFTITP